MCDKNDLRALLREAFDLGVKAAQQGMVDGSHLIDRPGENVVSMETLRERRRIADADAKAKLFEAPSG